MADKESTFWDHLDALRRVLVRVVAVVAVLGVGAFVAMPWIFDNVIMAPCSPSFPRPRISSGILRPPKRRSMARNIISHSQPRRLPIKRFVAMPWIFDNVIMAPCSPSFPVYELFDRIAGQTTADGFEVDVDK